MSRNSILDRVRQNASKMKTDLDNQNSAGKNKGDATFWNPPWDANKKSGLAVVGFLPFKDMFENENATTSPFIFVPDHTNLQTKKKKIWRVLCNGQREGMSCPICDQFWEFYNGSDQDKKNATKMGLSRKRHFMANIIILKNESNPEQVGQVFKWKFGITIRDKVLSKLVPEEGTGEDAIMIHDPENILPFKVKLKEKGGYRNYDDCEFLPTIKHVGDYTLKEDATEKEKQDHLDDIIDNKLYQITDFVCDEDYKTGAELQKIVDDVLDYYGQRPASTNKLAGTELPKEVETEVKVSKVEEVEEVEDIEIETSNDDEFNVDDLFKEED